MIAFAASLLLVPLADQAVKLLLRRRLGAGSVSLGALGRVRLVESQVWLARAKSRPRPAMLWTLWLSSAAGLTLLTIVDPSCGTRAGLLLGGSLSHALETTRRGGICDYVCLRFWPAFNAADVAITVGAGGLLLNLLVMSTTTSQ